MILHKINDWFDMPQNPPNQTLKNYIFSMNIFIGVVLKSFPDWYPDSSPSLPVLPCGIIALVVGDFSARSRRNRISYRIEV